MLDVNHIVAAGGLLVIALIVFSEVGLLLGFFLPGDTLLIAAGIFAAGGKLSLPALITTVIVAAIFGDNTGYWIGHHLGPRLFRKPDGIIFQKDHIERSQKFFEAHGSKTLLVSHFIAFVRTFVPLLAGAGHMSYRRFVLFNAVGDIAWGFGVTLVGYYFGSRIPNVDHYIMLVLGAVIALSIIPTSYRLIRLRLRKKPTA